MGTIRYILCAIAVCTVSRASLVTDVVSTVAHDALNLHRYILSRDTAYILGAFTPLYFLARHHDHTFHRYFYDKEHHKNRRQFHPWCRFAAEKGACSTLLTVAGLALFSSDVEISTTAQIFWTGLPFSWAVKNALKRIPFDGCLRPRNEYFDKHHRAYGGFPSGHMLEMAYVTTLFGLQLGPRWGVPFGLFAGFLGIEFAVGNRHYLSQLVAGAGLGVIYGVASHKLVNQKLAGLANFNLTVRTTPTPSIACTYAF